MSEQQPERRRMPDVRRSVTAKKTVCGFKLYVTASFFDDGSIGEIFIKVAKHGSMMAGLMNEIAVLSSLALQYGVPWPVVRDKMVGTQFERNGDVEHSSVLDGVAKIVDGIIELTRKEG